MTKGKNWKDALAEDLAALKKMEEAQEAAIAAGAESIDMSSNPIEQETNTQQVVNATPQTETPSTPVTDLKSMFAAPKSEEKPASTESTTAPDQALVQQLKELQAELQRLKSEDGRARALSDQAKQLRTENEQLREQLRQAQGKAQPLSGPIDEFSESEQEILTDEMQAIMASRFSQISKNTDEMRSKLEALEKHYAESQRIRHEADAESMNRIVANHFPDLGQIAQSDAWKNYCSEFDPVSGSTHGELFQGAVESCNTNAVIALISRFKAAAGIPSNTRQVGIRPEETSSPNPYNAPSNQGPKVFKASEIEAFMSDIASGRKSLRIPEYAKLYKAYREAMDDGRIV